MSKYLSAFVILVLAFLAGWNVACNSSNAPDNGIVPAVPLGLSWTTNASSAVVLFWEEVTSSPADGFHIYRKTGTSAWTVIGSTKSSVKTYVDTTVRKGSYSYRVTAYNGAGESGASLTIQINTTLFVNAPTALTITQLTPQNVYLTWNDNSLNEAGFLLVRSEVLPDTNIVTLDTLPANTTSYTDSKVSCGQYYQYEVLAFDSSYRSTPSKTVYVAVPFVGLSSQTAEAGQPLSSVFALNNSLAYVAGAKGAILKTTDGVTWKPLETGITRDLSAIWFRSDSDGFAIGSNGLIIHTTDGGNSWKSVASGKSIQFSAICFTTPDTGWIVGADGAMLLTTNGGSSWISRVSGTSRTLYSIRFLDQLHGYAVGTYSTVLATNDGGASWHAQAIQGGLGAALYAVTYDSIGIANLFGLSGALYHTSDAGSDWQLYYIGSTENLVAAASVGYYDAIALGSSGTILYSMNAGLSWARLPYTSTEEFVAASFSPDGTGGYVVGATGTIIPLAVCSSK
jgi:photosystem II stability/assembly factor-like uncharacterized protein